MTSGTVFPIVVIGNQIDALMFVKGVVGYFPHLISGVLKKDVNWQFAGVADKTGMVHSGERKLL
jgi:hypothetical protein